MRFDTVYCYTESLDKDETGYELKLGVIRLATFFWVKVGFEKSLDLSPFRATKQPSWLESNKI
jgi:hypothetical protein